MTSLLNLRRYPVVLILAVAGLVAVIFALLSVDLVRLAVANLDYLRRTGIAGIVDGGFLQAIGLASRGTGVLLCYFTFRLCEMELSRRYRDWTERQGN